MKPIITLVLFFYPGFLLSQNLQLASPNQNLQLSISINDNILYRLDYQAQPLMDPSEIALTLEDGTILGQNAQLSDRQFTEVRSTIEAVIPEKNKIIPENYNQLTLTFDHNFQLIFRLYDDGMAYRFVTQFPDPIKVKEETVQFNLAEDFELIRPVETSFLSHQEPEYQHIKASEFKAGELSSSSMLVFGPGPIRLFLTEADLQDYPGLYLSGTGSSMIKGQHIQVPVTYEVKPSGDLKDKRSYFPVTRKDVIAETAGSRSFPWRVVVVAENDRDLAANQITAIITCCHSRMALMRKNGRKIIRRRVRWLVRVALLASGWQREEGLLQESANDEETAEGFFRKGEVVLVLPLRPLFLQSFCYGSQAIFSRQAPAGKSTSESLRSRDAELLTPHS